MAGLPPKTLRSPSWVLAWLRIWWQHSWNLHTSQLSGCQNFRGKDVLCQHLPFVLSTYNLQQQTDTINPKTCPDVMMYAPPSDNCDSNADHERYWYAFGIYHTKVWTTHHGVKNGSDVCHMDFLWIRWLRTEPGYKHGFQREKLPKTEYVLSTDDYAFGFFDLKHVIRCCHLIPAFSTGQMVDLLNTFSFPT